MNGIIAIVSATPSPVDVNEIDRIVTVPHKGMATSITTTTRSGRSSNLNRTTRIQFSLDNAVPLLLTTHVVTKVALQSRGLISEIFVICQERILVVSTTRLAKAHVSGKAHRITQFGNLLTRIRLLVGCRVILILQQAPVESTVLERSLQDAVVARVVLHAATSLLRPFPSIHQLRLSRGNTARHTVVFRVLTILVLHQRSVHIIRSRLIPLTSQQRRHHRRTCRDTIRIKRSISTSSTHIVHILVHRQQERLQCLGHTLIARETAIKRISNHLGKPVITRNNHKARVIGRVEHIERRIRRFRCAHPSLGLSREFERNSINAHLLLSLQELASHSLCFFLSDRVSFNGKHRTHQRHKKNKRISHQFTFLPNNL